MLKALPAVFQVAKIRGIMQKAAIIAGNAISTAVSKSRHPALKIFFPQAYTDNQKHIYLLCYDV
jgi:hypothetical protein